MRITERQFEVLKLTVRGLSPYRIARKLKVDPPSVYSSLKSAKRNFATAAKMLDELKELGITTCTECAQLKECRPNGLCESCGRESARSSQNEAAEGD